jgi:ribosomal protein S18 acetylase RimI-like enzyme
MLEDLIIREFEKDDIITLRDLILDAENFGGPFLNSEMLNIRRDSISDFGRVFVATFKGEVVAYITLRRNIFSLFIDSIIVGRKHQRQGIGRALIEKARAYTRNEGLQVLRTDTASFMDYAISFYMACGFKHCGYVEHDFGLNQKQVHFYMDLTG